MIIERIENGFIVRENKFSYSFYPPKKHYFRDVKELVDFVKKYYNGEK